MFDKLSQQNIRIIQDFISPGESTLRPGESTLGPGESIFFFGRIDSEIGRMGHRSKRPQFYPLSTTWATKQLDRMKSKTASTQCVCVNASC